MRSRLTKPLTLLALQAAAFWPVWRWYATRLWTSADEAWGLLALATALVFLARVARDGAEREESKSRWLVPALLVAAYAAGYPFLPPLARAAVAVSALGYTASVHWARARFRPAVWGLLLLALPIAASAQFYCGYPLRVVTAECAAALLRFGGFMVVRQGTTLDWGGALVLVDAPCSGVRMLWMGFYLALTLSCVFGLSSRKTLLAAASAVAAVLAGNVLRASALFFAETGVVKSPAWMHEGAGVVAFAAVALAIVAMVRAIERGRLWSDPLTS